MARRGTYYMLILSIDIIIIILHWQDQIVVKRLGRGGGGMNEQVHKVVRTHRAEVESSHTISMNLELIALVSSELSVVFSSIQKPHNESSRIH